MQLARSTYDGSMNTRPERGRPTFADVTSGIASLETIEVSATVGSSPPVDDHSHVVELA
jgi:hypothetical protein